MASTADASRAGPFLQNSLTAGTKRKRAGDQKFYAVRTGKTPGIYYTWEECLNQVRGQKGALFKSFLSQFEAQAFVNGQSLESSSIKSAGEQKYYAVQKGWKPGVYTDWPSALEQIKGHRGPRQKKFNTRQEAEAFVKQGQRTNSTLNNYGLDPQPLSLEDQLKKSMYDKSAPGMVLTGNHAPKDKEGNTFEPGQGPFPHGTDDNFDPNIKLASDGTIVRKTEEEKRKTKKVPSEGNPPPMLKIFTDGSSLKNGQVGAQAGVGVYFGPGDPKYAKSSSSSHLLSLPTPSPSPSSSSSRIQPQTQTVYTIDWPARAISPIPSSPRKPWLTSRHPRNVSEALKGTRQTNQRAELTAVLRALEIAPTHRDVTIYTDSKYAIECVTNWFENWRRNGWVNAKGKPVENKDLVVDIRDRMEERQEIGSGTWFVWVKGHAGDEGNVAADELAVAGAHMLREREESAEVASEEDEDSERGEATGSLNEGSVSALAGEEAAVEESYRLMKAAMEDGDDGDDFRS